MNIEFHARKSTDGRKEFVGNRCGGTVERNLGEQLNHHQLPHVMFCRTCKQIKGQWLIKREMEDALDSMPVSE